MKSRLGRHCTDEISLKKSKQVRVIDELVQNLDFAPTFLDYAGVQIPSGNSRRVISSIGEWSEIGEWRDAIYYTYYEFPGEHHVKRHYGVRTDRYKLIHFYYDIDQWELYDSKGRSNRNEQYLCVIRIIVDSSKRNAPEVGSK